MRGRLSGIRVPIAALGGPVYLPQLVDMGGRLVLEVENPDLREVITLVVHKKRISAEDSVLGRGPLATTMTRSAPVELALAGDLAAELVRVQREILSRWAMSQLFFHGPDGDQADVPTI